MAKPSKIWRIVSEQPELRENLGRAIGVSPVMAQVLINRGIKDAEEARLFLSGDAGTLGNPFGLKDMDKAVARIKHAINTNQKIVIYGDYDVDGITATALLMRLLGRLGAVVDYYIPERQSEGYGLNSTALKQISESGAGLVITVDCGISATTEISEMKDQIDIIITDHHQPPETLPPAFAIINPKQPDCDYTEKNLAGVGVAFKLCQALWCEFKGTDVQFTEYLDVVALGTVADIVPLTGENRVIVKLGLAQMAVTTIHGLQALIKVTGLSGTKIDSGRVGFILAPRLNAAGRVAHAASGVELLLTGDEQKADELAQMLDSENAKRQSLEKDVLAAAEDQLDGIDVMAEKVLVLAGEDWHPGVIGIVASRLVDRYYRPVVMISIKDGIGKGSCRSIPGFDIFQALEKCADLLIQFGGHQQAAGMSIVADKIGALRQRLGEIAQRLLSEEDYQPVLRIDSRVALDEVNTAFLEQLAALAPHGMGNPCPVFMCEELDLATAKAIGQEGRHLKMKVRRSGASGEVIAWNQGAQVAELECADSLDLAFYPEFNEWQGQRTIQLKAHDVRVSKGGSPLKLIDARNTTDKVAYIKTLAEAGKALFVKVADRSRAIGLITELRRGRPDKARQMVCYYRGMNVARAIKALEMAERGEPVVLVSASDLEGLGQWPGDAVFYDPPLGLDELCEFAAQASERCEVLHLLYCQTDINYIISTQFPDRNIFGWIYLTLKEMTEGTRALFSGRLLARLVQRKAGVLLDESIIKTALEIFSELNLVDHTVIAQKWAVTMKPTPTGKLNLGDSATFQKLVSARDDYTAQTVSLLGKPVAEIRRRCLDKLS